MNHIPLDAILIPDNRQRQEFDLDSLRELAESIHTLGLMQPIVLRNDGKTLVSGERRLRAWRLLAAEGKMVRGHDDMTRIPFRTLWDLSPLELEEAELDENLKRADLTWQEKAAATSRLHKLRQAQKELDGYDQTVRDTATEILGILAEGSQIEKVKDDLILAEHLDDPEIASAKSGKEARKILDKRKAEEHRAKLAEEFGEIETKHEIVCGDSLKLFMHFDQAVDIILTDPPYGVNADKFGDQAGAKHEYKDDEEFALKCYDHVFMAAHMNDAKALFAFCDIRLFPTLIQHAETFLPSEWLIWPTPLIWHKGNGMLPVPDHGPRRNYEAIFFAIRKDRKWATTGSGDVFDVPALPSPVFGAQKPPALYQSLLSRVALPGDVVFDPFAGTCPVILACDNLQCTAICWEEEQGKIDYAKTEYLI